ncbi:MAG: N-acetylmuramoyl-L-alanine amidase [Steroidobacteraceae bacterium]
MDVAGSSLRTDNGQPVEFIRSPNQSAGLDRRFLILHYTAGLTAQGAIEWFKNPAAKASAHFVIGRNGAITQMVGLDRRAWHAGESRWDNFNGMNRFSIGIELVNAGRLKRTEGGDWMNWASVKIPPAEVLLATHKAENAPAGWHVYPEAQILAALKVAVALHAAFEFEGILGHEDVAPGRKADPGPAFPMTSFVSRVLGRKK